MLLHSRSFVSISATLITLALTCAAHTAQASGIPATLSLAGAQQQAVERSRLVAAQDFAITAARELAVAAGQLPDPVIKMGIDNLPADGPDRLSIGRDFMTMRRIGVMQEVTGGEKRRLRAARVELDAAKTAGEKVALIANIRRDTALNWLERYYADAMAAVVAEQLQQATLEIDAAEGAYRAGRGSQVDLVMARSARVMLEDKASDMTRRVTSATAALARWVGDAASAPLSGLPAMDTVPLDAQALEAQFGHHPAIAVLALQEDIADADVRVAAANKKSDWSVELSYAQRGSSYSNMVSFGLSIPLQWDQKNRQDREVYAKQALVDQARAQKDDALRAQVAEIRSLLAEWQTGRERQDRYRRELIPLASERTAAALGAYRGGKATLGEVLAGRRNEIDVRLQALQLESETARLWAQLSFLFPDDGASGHYAPVRGLK
ncbi:MAG: TolC family protein [Betaproteobacteria bacterium]